MPEVSKPWGHEQIWARTDRYVGKIIHVNAGHALSLQYHNLKDETIYLQSGKLLFEIEVGGVLQQRENLKFAALDCWKVVADNLPSGVTLERFGFGGDSLSLAGTAPSDQIQALDDFGTALQKAKNSDGSSMFNPNSEPMGYRMYNNMVDWNLTLKMLQQDMLKQ